MYKNFNNLEKFENKFKRNVEYDSAEIENFLNSLNLHNPSAYSYNRWNKGMLSIFPLFEWLERGRYKYLGPNYNYNGIILHFPQNKKGLEFEIGNWEDGVFKIYNFDSFKSWKENLEDDGKLIVSLNNKIIYGNESITQKVILTDDNNLISNFNGEYKYILNSSNLGKLLIRKKIGETFVFGKNVFSILNINL
jgi:hypothetical protein